MDNSGPVEVRAVGLGAMGGREVALLYPSAGKSWDLRSNRSVTLSDVDSTGLKLAVGNDAYVESKRQNVLPDEVTLTSYPNPIRDQATLEYTLPEERNVRIEVYDILGRRVAVLKDGQQEAGRHKMQLDGGRLASGVYFGRLKAGEQTLTQKITVVR
jgi:flagellar hook assembly protein FlgD